MEQMADDLAALLDALGIRRAGRLWSGCRWAAMSHFNFGGNMRPVAGVGAVRHARRADTAEAAAGRHQAGRDRASRGHRSVADAMMPKLFAPATIERKPRDYRGAARGRSWPLRPRAWRRPLRGMAARPDAPEISCRRFLLPTLVIVGERRRDFHRRRDAASRVRFRVRVRGDSPQWAHDAAWKIPRPSTRRSSNS